MPCFVTAKPGTAKSLFLSANISYITHRQFVIRFAVTKFAEKTYSVRLFDLQFEILKMYLFFIQCKFNCTYYGLINSNKHRIHVVISF